MDSGWKIPDPGDPVPYPNSPSWSKYLSRYLFPSLLSSKEIKHLTGYSHEEFYSLRDEFIEPWWQSGGPNGQTK